MSTRTHLLQKYYRVVQIGGFIGLLIAGLFIYLYPSYFLFLGRTHVVLLLCIAIATIHFIGFVLHEIFKKEIFFVISCYSWIVFFSALFVETGGVTSSLIYLFTFPVLVAGVDLKVRDVKIVTGIILLFLLSLFFIGPHQDSAELFRFGFTIFIFLITSYFIYSLVLDKEVIHRDFDRLMDIDRIKGDFLSVVSSRLHAPLTEALFAFSKLSTGEHSEDERKNLLDTGQKNVDVAISVVDELLRVVALDAQHLKIFPELVDIPQLIREIITEKDALIKKKEVQLSIITPPVFSMQANPQLIKLAFENMIDNAISYAPHGHIQIELSEEKKSVEVVISDDGIGIDEKDVPFVFERLHRGENAKLLEPHRSGIGAYAAKRIIELHNGTITVASKIGKGTTVSISLPFQ